MMSVCKSWKQVFLRVEEGFSAQEQMLKIRLINISREKLRSTCSSAQCVKYIPNKALKQISLVISHSSTHNTAFSNKKNMEKNVCGSFGL